MAVAQITELIDKVDNVENVGDLIAAILVVELANQQALATTAVKDPALWKARVFRERKNPLDEFTLLDPSDANKVHDPSPLINVWFDRGDFEKSASNVVERQKCVGRFNIDVYGYGVAQGKVGGHKPGDLAAGEARDRASRLVRNILMSGQYTYLGSPRKADQFIWSRWLESRTNFVPSIDERAVEKVEAQRLVFAVEFNEFAPQVIGQPLELIAVTVKRKETGEVYLKANYDLT